MNWQPIETAPIDGTAVVLFVPRGEYVASQRTKKVEISEAKVGEGLMFGKEWHWANDSCSCCYGPIWPIQPTHWMPPAGAAAVKYLAIAYCLTFLALLYANWYWAAIALVAVPFLLVPVLGLVVFLLVTRRGNYP